MKRMLAGLICALMLMTVLAGCAAAGSGTTTSQKTDDAAAGTQQAAAGDTSETGNADGSAAGEQQAPTGKVVYGEIADIAGNEVTLKLIEMPQMPQRDPNATTRPQGQQNQEAQASAAPQGAQTEGGGGNTDARRETKYTGETVELIIPVGMKITMNAFGQGGMGNRQRPAGGANGQNNRPSNSAEPRATRDPSAAAETEVELSALKVGWTLTITYQQDGTTIDKISARQPRTAGESNGSGN